MLKKGRRSNDSLALWTRNLLRGLKNLLIVACLGFSCWGWLRSIRKFTSGQMAMSSVMNESDSLTYPSITLCMTFKGRNTNIAGRIMNTAAANNRTVDNLSYEDMERIIDEYSYKRTDFLKVFSHSDPAENSPWLARKVLHNDSLWTVVVAHPRYTGPCYTYDPPFESQASKWGGIRFGIAENMVGRANKKEAVLGKLKIFIHDRGAFSPFSLSERPSSMRLDTSTLATERETSVALRMSRLTRISTDARPCESNSQYSLNACIEKHFSKQRGCQPPWYFFPEFEDIPICKNLTFFRLRKQDPYWHKMSLINPRIAAETGCPMPCHVSQYQAEITYPDKDSLASNGFYQGSRHFVALWFKSFAMTYLEEYMVCDWTCLLGEIGGNLGLFLGGSVLAYISCIVDPMIKKLE